MTDDRLEALRHDDAAWDAFVAGAAVPSYLQATPWAASKRMNGWSTARIVVDGPDGPIGAQILHRRAAPLPWRFGYAARGPIAATPLDPAAIAAFTAGVRREARGLRLSHLRIDPEVEDPDGVFAGALRAAGWRPVAEVQPQRTRRIDLARDEAAIWSDVHRKWRQNVTKAGRDGTRVVAVGRERLEAFAVLHRRTAARAGIPPRSLRAFEELWDAFAPHDRIHLFFAMSPDDAELAAQLVVGWGGTAAVLYSGITDEGQRQRVNYLLKWEAIKAIRALGYRIYDLWGLPTGPIADFKAGWGGRESEWVGAWDLTLSRLGRSVIEGAIGGRAVAVRARERVAGQRTRRRAAPTATTQRVAPAQDAPAAPEAAPESAERDGPEPTA